MASPAPEPAVSATAVPAPAADRTSADGPEGPGAGGAGHSAAAADGPDGPKPGSARPPYRKLHRSPHSRMLGGVAHGLAVHLGLPVTWVRAAFVLLFFANGIGVLLYAAFWFVVPIGIGEPAPGAGWVWAGGQFVPAGAWVTPDPLRKAGRGRLGRLRDLLQGTFQGEPVIAAQAVPGEPSAAASRRNAGQLAALLMLVVGVMWLLNALHLQSSQPYAWPLLAIGVGVALVWRQADDARWARWFGLAGARRRSAVARVGAGVLLVAAGIIGFLVVEGTGNGVGAVLEASLAVLAGVLVLVGPYALRLWQDLGAERTARIRAQERAEIAAHIHDSVLHTLTLIQRRSEDPKEVQRLARAQERELRLWLYRPEAAAEAAPDTLAERIRQVVAEVEDRHGVPIELVCVGDCPMDERIAAQMQAAREAMVNAAKYGGGGPVQVYAEVEGRTVLVFVRDHGPGFDPDTVPEDRMGVRESIIGRMKRNGGTARLRPAPDGGTEVELEMERAADE
ncbi:PspC domain-containing protein [Kitasatospora sp. RB6PN24]|uniref:ATP-binding protein n=1 Tax=Kitasatospora humi TaxID=2893891 RepID=UPI001E3F8317|nr:ATP-binding protein [Kitasatospora humi]MCC9310546.1 PspC domain-containing protein [Kitasatospora humi]